MTEAEAKKRWCPMVRVHTGMTDFVSAANRNLYLGLFQRNGGDSGND